jgi:hypothetical protein
MPAPAAAPGPVTTGTTVMDDVLPEPGWMWAGDYDTPTWYLTADPAVTVSQQAPGAWTAANVPGTYGWRGTAQLAAAAAGQVTR